MKRVEPIEKPLGKFAAAALFSVVAVKENRKEEKSKLTVLSVPIITHFNAVISCSDYPEKCNCRKINGGLFSVFVKAVKPEHPQRCSNSPVAELRKKHKNCNREYFKKIILSLIKAQKHHKGQKQREYHIEICR